MKILIDTNVILDLVQMREPFSDNASKVINSCVQKKHEGYISSHSLSDIFFILRKYKTVEERKELIVNLCKYFNVIPENKESYINVCLTKEWNDLEDGLQMQCAKNEKLDFIVTRDFGKGFNSSPVKVISVENFLSLYDN